MTKDEGSLNGRIKVEAGQVLPFGTGPDGEAVQLIGIANGGTHAAIMTWGASLQDLRRDELSHSLVLGSPNFEAYLDKLLYFGAIVGPVANRIANGRFAIDGRTYELERNEADKTTLHGGYKGTGQRNWAIVRHETKSATLSVRHPDGEAGFPGNVDVTVTYALDDTGALTIRIEASADQATHLNFAHHSYWNLDGSDNLDGHLMQIPASRYLAVDDDLIPAGDPLAVGGTPFDFLRPSPIKSPPGMALDHNFCIDRSTTELDRVCTLTAGRARMDVHSTEPGLQVYNAEGMDTAPASGHPGSPYGNTAGVALEPQIWPDAPNRPDFPSTLVGAGETYHQTTRFNFSVSQD